jgi:hypothetical protein
MTRIHSTGMARTQTSDKSMRSHSDNIRSNTSEYKTSSSSEELTQMKHWQRGASTTAKNGLRGGSMRARMGIF